MLPHNSYIEHPVPQNVTVFGDRTFKEVTREALVVKNPPANAGDIGDAGWIAGSGRSPGGGHGNPLQCSWLENPMDRGFWQAAAHGVHRIRHD